MRDGESLVLNGVKITPFRLAANYVYAFIFEEENRRVLIALDELVGWQPPAELRDLDLAVIPMGLMMMNPSTGQWNLPKEHPVLKSEATFLQTLEMVRQLKSKQVVMSHIEEPDYVSFDDLCKLETRLQADGLPISFAFDTMVVNV
jgi:phosphoribosyl 1,2-cyclic phosphate phosphodiesterase